MIRYALKCARDHVFESWFASSGAYESLRAAGHVTCPECGSVKVDKALMAPRIKRRGAPEPDSMGPSVPAPVAATPEERSGETRAQALARLRDEIERNSEYVGLRFAEEARQMHDGTLAARPIHGEASAKEARALLEEGVPVLPLPFIPRNRTN